MSRQRPILAFMLFFLTFFCLEPRPVQAAGGNDPAPALPVAAGSRLALVIGNDYAKEAKPLAHPGHDADDLRKTLRGLGFEVMGGNQQTLEAMKASLRDFGGRLKPGKVGLFYFAGYGVQARGKNYLIPAGSGLQRQDEVADRALEADRILAAMETAGADVNVLILDASRDYLPERSAEDGVAGLAPMAVRKGTLIAFAARPGTRAQEGKGRNSLYTAALLKYLTQPGIKIEGMFKRVRVEVVQQSRDQQIPWEESGLLTDFCFNGCGGPASVVKGPVTTPSPATPINPKKSFPAKSRETFTDCAGCPEMVRLPGGMFWMGSPPHEPGRSENELRHQVTVPPFAISKYEVTRGQFAAFVAETDYPTDPSCWTYEKESWRLHPERDWKTPGYDQGDRHPVVCVNAEDAAAYARWLGKKTGHGYRLPTEAEWEYAARAGTETPRYWDSKESPCDYANVADRTAQRAFSWGEKSYVHDCEDGVVHTAKVGMFQPNPFGLHDMLGNVWEWTCSAYDDKYGGAESLCTSDSDSLRVYRSSSWLNQPARVRAALRYKDEASFRSHTLGFRLVREHDPAR